PTLEQLAGVGGDNERYDVELRPQLAVNMIRELQNDGVEPDVWKLEGFEDKTSYELVVKQAQSGARQNVGVIILGRGQDESEVEQWLEAGRGVPEVIGFAVGRTVFWQALVQYRDGKIIAEQAARIIAERYLHFYQVFKS
ncbi:MAG: DUF2090 domain-containing protein, partial [Candidatus Kerfeldbacteria bacterium]|nr:DUF2090 domain-containing protein [Candidatus Kerfeldbacteria bacterium]